MNKLEQQSTVWGLKPTSKKPTKITSSLTISFQKYGEKVSYFPEQLQEYSEHIYNSDFYRYYRSGRTVLYGSYFTILVGELIL